MKNRITSAGAKADSEQKADVPTSSPNAAKPMLAAAVDYGAEFSSCSKYRYALWRVWDKSKPLVMFVGLNPSTANEDENDNTIKSVQRIAKHNGYGGFYMMNCFAYVSTDPKQLIDVLPGEKELNFDWLQKIGSMCKDVVFAWGSFTVVSDYYRDISLSKMFPNAKALHINKNGSPKHPLYCKSETKFVNWNVSQQ